MHRILLSKNHQHHLARRSPEERKQWIADFKEKWVGDWNYVLIEVDLEKLRHRRFKLDEKKVEQLVANPPGAHDTNYPILGRFSLDEEPHVILDGNHRLEAALLRGDKTVKAYVQEPMIEELQAEGKYALKLRRLEARRNGTPEPPLPREKAADDSLERCQRCEADLGDCECAEGPLHKAAYSAFVPVDLKPMGGRTPSAFPVDPKGHALTTLRAAMRNDPELLAVLAAFRGREGTPEASQAIAALLHGRSTARLS